MAMMITAVWALSALISVPALVVWKASPIEGQCYLVLLPKDQEKLLFWSCPCVQQ